MKGQSVTEPSNRCRLVLIASPAGEVPATPQAIAKAMKGGDVASVLLARFGAAEEEFRNWAGQAVPLIQAVGAAAVIVDDTQAAGRTKADGVHISGGKAVLADAVAKFQPRWIVGTGVPSSRHDALELGEERPDYLFAGKLDGDAQPEPNPKALDLAEWWAAMIEIPCIVMAGYAPESVVAAAKTGAEFVAVSAAVFGGGRDPEDAVASINALLDAEAPNFSEAANAN